jgi:limonene-1,2-epoxide hydrolase
MPLHPLFKTSKDIFIMKHFIVPFLAMVTLMACTKTDNKQDSESIAVVEKYKAAVEAKDIKAMDSLLADNYMGYGPSVSDSINKADAMANWKFNVDNLYESITFSNVQTLAKTVTDNSGGLTPGNWVSGWSLATIKYKDGRGPVQMWVNVEYRIENGKIVYTRTFYDEADVERQLNAASPATTQ